MSHTSISRGRLLQALGTAAMTVLVSGNAFAQGRCRDGYGTQTCPLSMDVATAPVKTIFAPTGWKTVALDHILFSVADYKKEAAFYAAVMGWTPRSDDGKQAVMDMGDWGSVIFRQAAPGTFDAPANTNPASTAGRGRGGRAPVTAVVESFCFVIDPWNRANVEKELRGRGLTPVADDDGKGFESFHVKDPDG